MIKISYLGPSGTFTEEALNRYCLRFEEGIRKLPCNTIEEAIDLSREAADYALVPVENSLGGSVLTTMDYLMKHEDIQISREVVMPIAHYLYGMTEVAFKDVEVVHSHPQALRQCSEFLKAEMPKAQLSVQNSTAEGASQLLTMQNPKHCLIGSEALGAVYPLKQLAGPIQNNQDNWTRFLLLKKRIRISLTV